MQKSAGYYYDWGFENKASLYIGYNVPDLHDLNILLNILYENRLLRVKNIQFSSGYEEILYAESVDTGTIIEDIMCRISHPPLFTKNLLTQIEYPYTNAPKVSLYGLTWLCLSENDYVWEENVINLSYSLQHGYGGISLLADAWLPINLDDNWQVEAYFYNTLVFENTMFKIKQKLNYTVSPPEDNICSVFGGVQKGFRLYNHPDVVDFALQYSNTPPPKGFNVKAYRILCQSLYDKING